jgi:DNA-binding transcriptional regulator YdaS (Cro superfamily)
MMRSTMSPKEAIIAAVEIAGGPTVLARTLKVKPSAVSNWMLRGKVSAMKAVNVEAAVGGQISRHDLRPDLYPRETANDRRYATS